MDSSKSFLKLFMEIACFYAIFWAKSGIGIPKIKKSLLSLVEKYFPKFWACSSMELSRWLENSSVMAYQNSIKFFLGLKSLDAVYIVSIAFDCLAAIARAALPITASPILLSTSKPKSMLIEGLEWDWESGSIKGLVSDVLAGFEVFICLAWVFDFWATICWLWFVYSLLTFLSTVKDVSIGRAEDCTMFSISAPILLKLTRELWVSFPEIFPINSGNSVSILSLVYLNFFRISIVPNWQRASPSIPQSGESLNQIVPPKFKRNLWVSSG